VTFCDDDLTMTTDLEIRKLLEGKKNAIMKFMSDNFTYQDTPLSRTDDFRHDSINSFSARTDQYFDEFDMLKEKMLKEFKDIIIEREEIKPFVKITIRPVCEPLRDHDHLFLNRVWYEDNY
jgi:hypothetical protein